MEALRGMGVALITPFNADLRVDVAGLTKLVEYNITNGANYLVALGTTAENATLTQEEKDLVIQTIVEVTNNRVPLVLGIGGNNTALLQQQVSDAKRLEGFDAILSVSPYYNRPSQEGIYQHYMALAAVAAKPIIMYNVPSRTGSNMEPETILRLANASENIIGIKEAGGNMEQARSILKDRPDGFLVLSGDDMLALPMVCEGGDGVISVLGQGLVSSFSEMIRSGLKNFSKGGDNAFAKSSSRDSRPMGERSGKAYKTHNTLVPAIDLIFEEGNPAGIKSLLSSLGICEDHVRLPLVKATESLAQKIKAFLNDFA